MSLSLAKPIERYTMCPHCSQKLSLHKHGHPFRKFYEERLRKEILAHIDKYIAEEGIEFGPFDDKGEEHVEYIRNIIRMT